MSAPAAERRSADDYPDPSWLAAGLARGYGSPYRMSEAHRTGHEGRVHIRPRSGALQPYDVLVVDGEPIVPEVEVVGTPEIEIL